MWRMYNKCIVFIDSQQKFFNYQKNYLKYGVSHFLIPQDQ